MRSHEFGLFWEAFVLIVSLSWVVSGCLRRSILFLKFMIERKPWHLGSFGDKLVFIESHGVGKGRRYSLSISSEKVAGRVGPHVLRRIHRSSWGIGIRSHSKRHSRVGDVSGNIFELSKRRRQGRGSRVSEIGIGHWHWETAVLRCERGVESRVTNVLIDRGADGRTELGIHQVVGIHFVDGLDVLFHFIIVGIGRSIFKVETGTRWLGVKQTEVIGWQVHWRHNWLGFWLIGAIVVVNVEEDIVEQLFGLFWDKNELLVEEVTPNFLPILKNANTYIFNTSA